MEQGGIIVRICHREQGVFISWRAGSNGSEEHVMESCLSVEIRSTALTVLEI